MKHILLLLIPLLATSYSATSAIEPEAQTYLKLYTMVTGTADNRVENWMLANNGTRRIVATVEILGAPDGDKTFKERKNVIIESKSSLLLGTRSVNGSAPNTVVIISAVYTPSS